VTTPQQVLAEHAEEMLETQPQAISGEIQLITPAAQAAQAQLAAMAATS
jgi:hypothetical protein